MKLIKPLAVSASLLGLLMLVNGCATNQQAETPSPLVNLAAAEAAKESGWQRLMDRFRGNNDLLSPDQVQALGDAALLSGDYQTSIINYLAILKKNPERYDLHYKIGILFLLNGQWQGAQDELALVLVHHPEWLQAHEALGLVHLAQKNYPLAIQEFQTVLARAPNRINSLHLLGEAYLRTGQPSTAVVYFKQALAADPGHVSSLLALGQAYMDLKDYQQAVACLQRGLALDPKNEKLNYEMGMALAAERRYEEALNAFMKAGDEAQAYNNVGVYYFVAGQYEDAAKCFQRAIELRPTYYGEAKINLQRALEKLHQASGDNS